MRRAAALAAALALGCSAGAPLEAEPDPPEQAAPEAGFIDIEPVTYALRGGATSLEATSSRARIFYSFHPARAEGAPLFAVYSGGPGASTAILLGGNTAERTLDPSRTGGAPSAAGPAPWTAFANVLYIDARGAGLSYGVAEGMDDDAARAAEFTVRNFNPFLDAADVVRTLLRFLASHPDLRGRPVVLAGESYGGVRTEVALHLLHHPDRYDAGAATYEDPALAAEIRAHFEAAGTTARSQFDRAALLQPRLSSPMQQAAAGAALEAEGSPLYEVAAETGVPFVPCKDKPSTCQPFANVLDYLDAAGRDIYDVRRPSGDAFARYAAIGARLAEPEVMAAALGVEPASIAGLPAADRAGAYRVASAPPEAEPLAAELGAIAPYDRYFKMELFTLIGAPFSGAEAIALGVERQGARYGELFLEDLLDVRMFVTNASHDAIIWTPALPAALAMYADIVASAREDGGEITVEYRAGALGAPAGATRSIRFPSYEASGHSVSLDEPEKLAADLDAWLAE